MKHEELTDAELEEKLDEAILNADPDKLTDDELDRRLYLRQTPRHDFQDSVLDVAGGIAKTLDYPMGIARSAADAALEVGKKDGSSEKALNTLKKGVQADGTTPQALAQKIGVPDDPIPGTNIPQSAVAGLGIDLVGGIGEAKVAGEATKLLGKGVRKLLDGDEMALKATGTTTKDFKSMINSSPVEDPMKEAREYGHYATKNFIRPFNSTEKLLKKVGMKWEEVGRSIGSLRQKNADIVTKWLSKNPNNMEVRSYLDNTFNPQKSIQRIFSEVDESIPSARAAEQIKDQITKELEPLHMKYQGAEIPMSELAKLKTFWQNEINFGKDAADYSIREAANDFLQREANRAIDNEFEFADKWMKGTDKTKHAKLKEEYGLLSKMYSNIAAKAAREGAEKSNILTSLNPLNNDRLQTAIASIPRDPVNLVPGMKSGAVGAGIGALQVPNMRAGEYKEPMIEGFPVSKTVKALSPMDVQELEKTIQKSDLSNVEKAKRLNLLRKHGLIYIGQ